MWCHEELSSRQLKGKGSMQPFGQVYCCLSESRSLRLTTTAQTYRQRSCWASVSLRRNTVVTYRYDPLYHTIKYRKLISAPHWKWWHVCRDGWRWWRRLWNRISNYVTTSSSGGFVKTAGSRVKPLGTWMAIVCVVLRRCYGWLQVIRRLIHERFFLLCCRWLV